MSTKRRRSWLATWGTTLTTCFLVGCAGNEDAHLLGAEEPLATSEAAASVPARTTSAVGTNLAGVSDWSSELVFRDLFKMSKAWTSGSASAWNDKRPIDVDGDGWVRSLAPGQIARTVMLTSLPGAAITPGAYVIRYRGKGTIEYFRAQKDELTSRPGRDVVQVTGGFGLFITATDPVDYLRDIQVFPPGGVCEKDLFLACMATADCGASGRCVPHEQVPGNRPFNPAFLTSVRMYRGLRFMDWMKTNNSPVTTWETRGKWTDARWSTDRGTPPAVMVLLANTLGADAWFNIPHQADDTYVRRLADYVAANLRRDLVAYIEYSNEVWNGSFGQHRYAAARGRELGLAQDDNTAALRFHGKRSAEIGRIWKEAMPEPGRLVRVLGAQAANPWTIKTAIEQGDTAANIDAVAIAPYFGGQYGRPGQAETTQDLTVDQMFALLIQDGLPQARSFMDAAKVEIASRGKRMIAYEAGQHLVGTRGNENNPKLNALFDAVNRDPRIDQVLRAYLREWKAAGGNEIFHFNSCAVDSKWGRWGAIQYLGQQTPKYQALSTFIRNNRPWW